MLKIENMVINIFTNFGNSEFHSRSSLFNYFYSNRYLVTIKFFMYFSIGNCSIILFKKKNYSIL